jgi:hypothetical protein
MTIETKGTIELQDIIAVEFRCKCGSLLTRKLSELFRVPISCGDCDAQWYLPQSQEAQNLEMFFRNLARYRASKFPCDLRLVVTGLDEHQHE